MPRKGPAPKRPRRHRPGATTRPLVTSAREQGAARRQEVDRREDRLRRPRGLPARRPAPTRSSRSSVRSTTCKSHASRSRAVASVAPPTRCPIEVKAGPRPTTLALRWLITYSRQRREKTMTERLMNELLDASNGLGASGQAPRGHAQDGRVQQGLRALPLVSPAAGMPFRTSCDQAYVPVSQRRPTRR